VTRRSAVAREISAFFRASVFPADRYDLYAEAISRGAPEVVLEALHRLPAGTKFSSPDEVWSVLVRDPEVQAHVMPPEPSGPAEASSRP
jgi:Protein of unknown function (DUF2795)